MKAFFEEYGRTIVTVLIILGIILVGYAIAGNGKTSAFGKFTAAVVDNLDGQTNKTIDKMPKPPKARPGQKLNAIPGEATLKNGVYSQTIIMNSVQPDKDYVSGGNLDGMYEISFQAKADSSYDKMMLGYEKPKLDNDWNDSDKKSDYFSVGTEWKNYVFNIEINLEKWGFTDTTSYIYMFIHADNGNHPNVYVKNITGKRLY